MKIGIVGYRNHAATLIEICNSCPEVQELVIFHPDHDKRRDVEIAAQRYSCSASTDITDLYGLDAVLVAAPAKFHSGYIESLVDHVPALLCEKPPVISDDEISRLNQLTDGQKEKIYFNFHMAHSDLFKIVDERIKSNAIGQFLSSSMIICHGIAFRESMKNNWRFTSKDVFDSIVGNLGVHYINMYERWFGDVRIKDVETGTFGKNGSVDSVSLVIETAGSISSRILLSYAAPFLNEKKFIFTDGYISQEESGLNQYSPRDRFDESGKFATPNLTELTRYDGLFDQNSEALKRSVFQFLENARNNVPFPISDFDSGLETVKKILRISERYMAT
jgi:predicted dehydrogenase